MTELRDWFRRRRENVQHALGEDAALVLSATPELSVGRDTELKYVVDPEVYYLTGYQEPEAVIVLTGGNEGAFTMFVRARDPERELWTGTRGGVEAASEQFGADAAYPIGELHAKLPGLLASVDTIYARLDITPELDALLKRALVNGRRERARSGRGPMALVDPGVLLDGPRALKDAHEIAAVRQAAAITAAGFCEGIRRVRPGAGEWEVEAALEAGFRSRGADGIAFPSIVASGSNATILHYVTNRAVMQAGDLLLMDAGARYHMYCGDISRTVPVSGRFSAGQRLVYEAVLEAQTAAIAVVRPGVDAEEPHKQAVRRLVEAMRELKLIDVSVEQALEDESIYKRYFPHRTSHWLGLETHDVGAYALRTGPRLLEAGMVLTIEPGLYIPNSDSNAPPELRGIGVRIEDDVLVTPDGHEVLTASLPTQPDDLEALLSNTT
jgi:Xaa-Pro aminopeptidase